MIVFENVTKSLGSRIILDGIDLRLKEGQTHVVLGLSGSGKSTVMRLMVGLLLPDQGHVKIEGMEVCKQNRKEIVSRIGYVVQEGGLFPHFTAEKNISLVPRLRAWNKDKVEARFAELAPLFNLDRSLLKRYPKELSGGQRQRVSLMRALMPSPPLLLLDEPLGALDPITRFELQTELKRIFNHLKKTVVIVTHDLGEAAYFGHTITLLHEGKIIQHGTFEDLVRRPAHPFVTEFIKAQRPPPELEATQ